MIHEYNENENGGIDYVVGDIHGCFSRLERMLQRIGFDKTKDRLFCLGDLVDRGPESHKVLDFLANEWVIALAGNHDDMAIDYAINGGDYGAGSQFEQDYRANGGEWNINASYGFTQEVKRAFEKLPLVIEYKREGKKPLVFVHADLPFNSLAEMREKLEDPVWRQYARINCMWERRRAEGERKNYFKDIDTVIVGHTVVPRPVLLQDTLYIDTGAVFQDPEDIAADSGYFTILRLSDMTLLSETGGFPYASDRGYIHHVVGDLPLDLVVTESEMFLEDGTWYACYHAHTHQFMTTVYVMCDPGGDDLVIRRTNGYIFELMPKFGLDFYELTMPVRY